MISEGQSLASFSHLIVSHFMVKSKENISFLYDLKLALINFVHLNLPYI